MISVQVVEKGGKLVMCLMGKMHRFLIVIEKADGNYSAYSPDLPGCVATGKTRDQAARNMHEAVDLHVRGLLEDKLPVPQSRSFAEYRGYTGASRVISLQLDRRAIATIRADQVYLAVHPYSRSHAMSMSWRDAIVKVAG